MADRMVGLGMVTEEKAAAVLAGIAEWREDHLDEDLDERDVFGWLPEFGIAVSVHGEDVDFVESYYAYLLEKEVTACTGGAVVVTDVVLVRDEDDEDGAEYLHFLRNGEPVWWHVEHESDDYVDQAAVSEQINDLDPGGDDPRVFYELLREKREACQDDVYVLASPEQAGALRDEFGLDFHGLDMDRTRPGEQPTAEPGTVEWYMQDDRRYMTEPAKVSLDGWLSGMVDALDGWRARFLPEDFPFDFTLDSLDALQRQVLHRFADWNAVDSAADDPFVVGAVRYVGETLIRHAPGHWGYHDTADSMYGRVPLIRSNTPGAFRAIVVPLHRLSRVAEDRRFGILRESVEALQEAADEYATALRALGSIRRSE
ncbi:hypothetical protein GCM10023196_061600 [Actinoallomurus vinaceus]|uniref:DUF3806 domain-containing protein n=1 Tax=Actinoallomurus vinaceus TaxID=1080074 RepID=A0ABP8UGQ3_9ACTN